MYVGMLSSDRDMDLSHADTSGSETSSSLNGYFSAAFLSTFLHFHIIKTSSDVLQIYHRVTVLACQSHGSSSYCLCLLQEQPRAISIIFIIMT